jgi:hypothetical protein
VDGKWTVVNSVSQRNSAGGKKKKDDEHFIKLVFLFNTGKKKWREREKPRTHVIKFGCLFKINLKKGKVRKTQI